MTIKGNKCHPTYVAYIYESKKTDPKYQTEKKKKQIKPSPEATTL